MRESPYDFHVKIVKIETMEELEIKIMKLVKDMVP